MQYEILKQSSANSAVLINVPFGKRYLSAPKQYVDQPSQKGNTCWYYTNTLLHPRYGKEFPLSFRPRRIEYIISQFRKQLTSLTHHEQDINSIVEVMGTKVTKHVLTTRLLPRLDRCIEIMDIEWDIKKYLAQFLNQHHCDDLDAYTTMYIQTETVSAYKNLLKKFNFDVDGFEASLQINLFAKPSEEKQKIIQSIFWNKVKEQFTRHYNFKALAWRKEDGFDALMQALIQKGPIKCIGTFGDTFYTERVSAVDEKFGKWDVYTWKPDTLKREEPRMIHAMVVIGMESLEQQKFVYFLDPNYPVTVTGPNKIFKISYEEFLVSLHTINGGIGETAQGDAYGLQADIAKNTYLYDLYTHHQLIRQLDARDALTAKDEVSTLSTERAMVSTSSNKHLTPADLYQFGLQPVSNKHLTPADLYQFGLQPVPNKHLTPGDLHRYGRFFATGQKMLGTERVIKSARELTPADLPRLTAS